MPNVLWILVAAVVIFILWWFKGARDAYQLKDKLVLILVNKYGFNRTKGITVIDINQRFIYKLHQENVPPEEIAKKLYHSKR